MFSDPNGQCREVGALLTWIDCGSIQCSTSSLCQPERYYGGHNNPKHKEYVTLHRHYSEQKELQLRINIEQLQILKATWHGALKLNYAVMEADQLYYQQKQDGLMIAWDFCSSLAVYCFSTPENRAATMGVVGSLAIAASKYIPNPYISGVLNIVGNGIVAGVGIYEANQFWGGFFNEWAKKVGLI